MISSSEISVVIQGPTVGADGRLLPELARTVDSVRTHLPEAEIILSTWEGAAAAADMNPDCLLLNPDPGGLPYRPGHSFENNVNRQIRSTLEGLRKASRPYALKLRTDLHLVGTGFLTAFGNFPGRADKLKVFQERIVCCSSYCANPRYSNMTLFHPSDWAHFGLRTDLLKIWEIPEVKEREFMRWFDIHPVNWEALSRQVSLFPASLRRCAQAALSERRNLQKAGFRARFTPEQYIWVSALWKVGYQGFQHGMEWSQAAVSESELALVNNWVVLHAEEFGLLSSKYDVTKEANRSDLYTHWEWLRLYAKVSGNEMRLQPRTLYGHLRVSWNRVNNQKNHLRGRWLSRLRYFLPSKTFER